MRKGKQKGGSELGRKGKEKGSKQVDEGKGNLKGVSKQLQKPRSESAEGPPVMVLRPEVQKAPQSRDHHEHDICTLCS